MTPATPPARPIRKKGGRPKSETKRDKQITVCLSAIEYLAVKRRTEKAGLTLSDYGRQMVLTGQAQVKLSPEENAVLNEVARLGNNLNQIAKKANADGIRSIAIEAARLLGQLNQLLNKPTEP